METVIDLHIDSGAIRKFLPEGYIKKILEHKIFTITIPAKEIGGEYYLDTRILEVFILKRFSWLKGFLKKRKINERIIIPLQDCEDSLDLFGSCILPSYSSF